MIRTLTKLACLGLMLGFLTLTGCAESDSGPIEAPSGNELQQFLAENPDIDNAVYEDDELAEE